jgi:hypothetical protein
MNIELNNLGLVLQKLPDDIFSYLNEELSDITTHEQMISGMSGLGVPKHYYLKDSTPLTKYVLSASSAYFDRYNSIISYKRSSDGVDPSCKLQALEPWVNVQRKNEWIPAHDHSGVMAYTVWMKVPEANIFEILYSTITGETMKHHVHVTRDMEGFILMFPSKLMHTVHPFHNSNEVRISISGNLILK